MESLSKDFFGKRLLLIGLGVSGRSAAKILLAAGSQVSAYDMRWKEILLDPEINKFCQQGLRLGPTEKFKRIENFDAVVVSPGISPSDQLYRLAIEKQIEIIGEAELALRYLKSPCIGVTGTNGKTTVTMLIAHVLNFCGIQAKAVGNIGIPLTELLMLPKQDLENTTLVVELSSYQLETLCSRALDIALLLNITPDHLERHGNMQEYAKVKSKIFQAVKPAGSCFTSKRCIEEWPNYLAQINVFDAFENELKELKQSLQGHDFNNALAAYAVCRQQGIDAKQFVAATASFSKPPHRLQQIASIHGIDYIDDSKATNIDAVIQAVGSLMKPIVLIVGGVDKGFTYKSWIDSFKDKVRKIFAIGKAASKINNELSEHFMIQSCTTLDEAVIEASDFANAGDIVLLSPGCASYDMFTDYAHRGMEFQRIVNSLRR